MRPSTKFGLAGSAIWCYMFNDNWYIERNRTAFNGTVEIHGKELSTFEKYSRSAIMGYFCGILIYSLR